MRYKFATPTITTFFTVWLGQSVSLIGSGLTGFALGVWAFERSGSITQFALIGLFKSRFEASRVLDILEFAAVRNKFKFSVNDISGIRTWIKETNISWGIDSKHRGILGLPEFNENTWKFGIDRMLLGYAMPVLDNMNFNGIFPYNTESDSSLLGKFSKFFNIVKEL